MKTNNKKNNVITFFSINISVRRLGGSYGAKITRGLQTACACALAAYKLNRPVRFILTIEENMLSNGKRNSTLNEYEVGVDDNGVVQYLQSTIYENVGSSINELAAYFVYHNMGNCSYDHTTWETQYNLAKTDIPSNISCRAPGFFLINFVYVS